MWPLIKHFITMYSKQDAEMYPKENQPKKNNGFEIDPNRFGCYS